MSINRFIIYIVSFIVFVSAISTSMEISLKYIKYLIFPIITLVLFFTRSININPLLKNNISLYVFLITINLMTSLVTSSFSARFVEEVFFIFLPLLSAFLLVGFKKIEIDSLIRHLFWSYVLAFVIFNFQELIFLPRLILNFVSALKLSYFPTESWMAFPFGMFTLYFLVERKYKMFFIAIFFFLMSFKRISMVGLLISVGVYFFYFGYLKKDFNKFKLVGYFLIFNTLLTTILYFFINGYFTKLIYNKTGITINHFSQGRFQIYNDVINHFSDKIWTGSSLGFTHVFLSRKYVDISLLHSDILKIIIELGLISFFIWIFYFLVINLNNQKSVLIVLFINVLFLSDNVFIYYDTLFVFYLILVKFYKDALPQEANFV